jgi:1-acyl-sn-glycerol-3-phosphate acyltransferase
LKSLWYNIIKVYVNLGLFFTLKKIKVIGKKNIPKNGAVIFIGNHQNALIDALLIPTTNGRTTFFLARASAFKNKLVKLLLSSVNMIPVYRMRDGIKTINKNYKTFEKCTEILKKEQTLEIFAEGEHHSKRRVLPLKKGFARIILATLKKHPNLPIQIIPVGINYDHALKYPCSVSICYGKSILANDFIDTTNVNLKFSTLINKVHFSLKNLTTHIEDLEQYDALIQILEEKQVNYLNPLEVNKCLENHQNFKSIKKAKNRKFNWLVIIHVIAKLNSIFPLLIWKYLKSIIKDKIFLNTYRFAVITTIFPLFYLLQTWLIYYFLDIKTAVFYLICCICLGIISTKTTEIT